MICDSPSGVIVAVPGWKGIGSIWTFSIRASAVYCRRPIQLTGVAMALMATVRADLQMASLKSKRGSSRRPLTGKETLISPLLFFMSEAMSPRGRPIRACAWSFGPARSSSRCRRRMSDRASTASPRTRPRKVVIRRPSRAFQATCRSR
jgi:hypothetical protein